MCSICDASAANRLPGLFWGGDLGAASEPIPHAMLPSEVYDASDNPYGKTSYDLDVSAAQITRNNRKWDDQDYSTQIGGDPNALGTPGTVTYGYLADSAISTSLSGVEDAADHRALTAGEIAQVEYAITLIEQVANIDFVRVGSDKIDSENDAEIAIMGEIGTNGGYAATAGFSGTIFNSLVNIGVSGLSSDGSYAFSTALHELGHALGLSHPADYNASDDAAPTYENSAIYFEDSRQYSLMSYFSEGSTGAAFNGRHPINLMLHDVAALQRLYGANTTTRTGDDVYGVGSNTNDRGYSIDGLLDYFVGTIWDAGGTDTIDVSVYGNDQVIDLRATAFSSTGGMTNNLSIAAGVVIENAIGGSGDDLLVGNAADNLLDGGVGLSDTASFADATVGLVIDLNDAGGAFALGAGVGTDTLRGIENLIGGDGNDRLVGTADSNALDGGAGDDTLVSGGGLQDIVLGGAGRDLADLSGADYGLVIDLTAGTSAMLTDGEITVRGVEDVIGSAFADEVLGTAGQNSLEGGEGADTLVGFDGADVIFGGAGADLIIGDQGQGYEPLSVRIQGTAAADTLTGNRADNEMEGLGGDDVMRGGEGADTMDGGAGNDSLLGEAGDDSLLGGSGIDTLDGGEGADTLVSGFADSLLGGAGTDLLLGGAGADTLRGGADVDTIFGEGGNDDIEAGAGADEVLAGDGNDSVLGLSGDDTLDGGGGRDTIDGGDGVDLLFGGADADLIRGGDNAAGLETLVGEGGDDSIYGGLGEDYIIGGDGADYLLGEDGDDFMTGEAGADTLDGGEGDDRAYFYNSEFGVAVDLSLGIGTAGDAAGDTFVSIEGVYGSAAGADTLRGGNGDDYMEGWGGDDRIEGGLGNDLLVGGDGSDTILGGAGDDLIFGGGRDNAGTGSSVVTGGQGADRFAFLDLDDGATTVTDFEDGVDQIDVSRIGVTSLVGVSISTDVQGGRAGVLIEVNGGTGSMFLEGTSTGEIDTLDFLFA